MNAFIPENPKVVQMIVDGQVRATANNIDPNLQVVIVDNATSFERESAGVTFNSTRPLQQTQTLAHRH